MSRQMRFKGLLSRPIDYPFDPPKNEAQALAYEKFEAQETEAKYEPIFAHYRLNYDDGTNLEAWKSLAISMIIDLVPGFEFRYSKSMNKGGRPKLWPEEREKLLAQDVEHVRAKSTNQRRKTLKGACEYLARSPDHPQWHPPAGREFKKWVDTLEDCYCSGTELLKTRRADG